MKTLMVKAHKLTREFLKGDWIGNYNAIFKHALKLIWKKHKQNDINEVEKIFDDITAYVPLYFDKVNKELIGFMIEDGKIKNFVDLYKYSQKALDKMQNGKIVLAYINTNRFKEYSKEINILHEYTIKVKELSVKYKDYEDLRKLYLTRSV